MQGNRRPMATTRLRQRCVPRSGILADSRTVDKRHNTMCDTATGFHTLGQNENIRTVVQLQFRTQAIPLPQPPHGTLYQTSLAHRTRLSPLNYSFQLSAGCLAGRCFGGWTFLMGCRPWFLRIESRRLYTGWLKREEGSPGVLLFIILLVY